MCYAGSFIQGPSEVSKAGRVIVTSTNDQNLAFASEKGALLIFPIISFLPWSKAPASSAAFKLRKQRLAQAANSSNSLGWKVMVMERPMSKAMERLRSSVALASLGH